MRQRSLWHPWKDKPGRHHQLAIFKNNKLISETGETYQCMSLSDFIEIACIHAMYVFVDNPSSHDSFPWIDELLVSTSVEVYASETGGIVGAKLHHGRKIGYLIDAAKWGMPVGKSLIETVSQIFDLVGYEAITPASLSERILRSLLDEKIFIKRPSHMVREKLLEHSGGGRIDTAVVGKFFEVVYEYDLNKAYPYFAQSTPSPWVTPVRLFQPRRVDLEQYATGILHCQLQASDVSTHPIQVRDDEGIWHKPRPGEMIEAWLWKEELDACRECGYSKIKVMEAEMWTEKSDWLTPWSDLLMGYWTQAPTELAKLVIKKMQVGLPGRFIRKPYHYSILPLSLCQVGDIPILCNNAISDFVLHKKLDMQSAALSHIGAHIIMQCRLAMYHMQKREEELGNTWLQTYVDCIRFTDKLKQQGLVGLDMGQYKEKIHHDVLTFETGFISREMMMLPGMKEGGVLQAQARAMYGTFFV